MSYGAELVDLMAEGPRGAALEKSARGGPSWDLTPRQLCDLELLLNGGFSPLSGFLGRTDYESVCRRMRLADGGLWPIPVTLDVPEDVARRLAGGDSLALRDPEGVLLAVLHVRDVWEPDREAEAERVYGTRDAAHPGVRALRGAHAWCVGGPVEGVRLPTHHDFRTLRLTPAQLRRELRLRGWEKVVAFQTRNPMHGAHVELALRAAREVGASLLLHPAVGATKPGDVDHYTRVRCYQAVLPRFEGHPTMLALLPLAMRMAGPREALWHAIIRRNHGCTHLIVGRDHAGPGADASGRPFYGAYEAQELLRRHEAEVGLRMVPAAQLAYCPDLDRYVSADERPAGAAVLEVSGAELSRRLAGGGDLPAWLTFPEVAEELRKSHPPRARQGFTVFFTGLSGAGKSTLAGVLLEKLLEIGGRAVTLLDGDVVRKLLSSELGFSREHRDLNVRRIGFVAAAIARSGGVALCAAIAPHDGARREVREMVSSAGGFVLVHVSTPLAVCEERDRKGLYARARAGLVPEFTGISSPYEEPTDAELVIDAGAVTVEEAAQEILAHLRREGYLPAVAG